MDDTEISNIMFIGCGNAIQSEESTDYMAKFLQMAKYLDDGEDLILIINTSGGEEDVFTGLYDFIKSFNRKIITIGCGNVSSNGVLLMQLGKIRLIYPNTFIVVHQYCSNDVSRQFNPYNERMRKFKKIIKPFIENEIDDWARIVLTRINETRPDYTFDLFKEFLHHKNPMTPKEFVDFGLADDIITYISDYI